MNYPGIDAEPEDEITDLKNRVAKLEAALAHEREEREALQQMLVGDQIKARGAVEEAIKDFELTRDAIDERLHELAKSDLGTAAGIGEIIADALRLVDRLAASVHTLADSQIALLDRQEAIERLLGPALAGRVKLMAQEV